MSRLFSGIVCSFDVVSFCKTLLFFMPMIYSVVQSIELKKHVLNEVVSSSL